MKAVIFGLIASATFASTVAAAPPVGDTQGRVQAVTVDHNYARGYNSFLIYITDVENDRFGCIGTNGYVRVKDNGIGVDQNNFKQMFALVVAAQLGGKRIGLSSSGSDPCSNVNGAWMYD